MFASRRGFVFVIDFRDGVGEVRMFGVSDRWFQGLSRAAVYASLVLSLKLFGDRKDHVDRAEQRRLRRRIASRPDAPVPLPLANNIRDPATPKSQIFSGEGDVSGAAASTLAPAAPGEEAVARGADSYDLNFQNADINAVTKVLLGDLLKLTYSVDPRVQGTLSLSSGRPVAQDLMPTVRKRGQDRQRQCRSRRRHLQSRADRVKRSAMAWSITAKAYDARLRHHRCCRCATFRRKAVLRAVDSFAAKPGHGEGRQRAQPAARAGYRAPNGRARSRPRMALDVDWMKNQSVGIFPVRNASPDTIITELAQRVRLRPRRRRRQAVRFQPINRLNAVLAVGANSNASYRARSGPGWRVSTAPITTTPPSAFTSCATATPSSVAAILQATSLRGRAAASAPRQSGPLGNLPRHQLHPAVQFRRFEPARACTGQPGTSSSTTSTQTAAHQYARPLAAAKRPIQELPAPAARRSRRPSRRHARRPRCNRHRSRFVFQPARRQ